MRSPVKELRHEAAWFRDCAREHARAGHRADVDVLDADARKYDRAADLLESLADPPTTAEGLRERVAKLFRGDDCLEVKESGGVVAGLWLITEEATMLFHSGNRPADIRAAWFAIVGMMEVERG